MVFSAVGGGECEVTPLPGPIGLWPHPVYQRDLPPKMAKNFARALDWTIYSTREANVGCFWCPCVL